MPSVTRLRALGLAILAATVLSAGQAAAQSPDAVARTLQQRYRQVRTLSADFVQSTGNTRLTGRLQVRGDAFRMTVGEQTLVTDGRTLWSYAPDDEQVVVQDYDAAQTGFSIGQLFTDYLRVFRAVGATRATLDGVRHDVLTLRPRDAGSSVRDATLYVRSSDAIPTRVRVRDTNGTLHAFDLSRVQLNPSLPASTFTFTPPRGTEVVDLR
jgi:outer membrane lipoprotein carrier protein